MKNEKLTALEAEIFPQRKSKRIHISELQEAWAAHVKTLEPWWRRWWNPPQSVAPALEAL